MFSGLLDSGAGGEREVSSGNLPLSEGVLEYSGETTGIGTPHASRAGGTVADIQERKLKDIPTMYAWIS